MDKIVLKVAISSLRDSRIIEREKENEKRAGLGGGHYVSRPRPSFLQILRVSFVPFLLSESLEQAILTLSSNSYM